MSESSPPHDPKSRASKPRATRFCHLCTMGSSLHVVFEARGNETVVCYMCKDKIEKADYA